MFFKHLRGFDMISGKSGLWKTRGVRNKVSNCLISGDLETWL